eukprot:COSAG02_NODE_349_length_24073_cov_102.816092_4_plen_134_part_00
MSGDKTHQGRRYTCWTNLETLTQSSFVNVSSESRQGGLTHHVSSPDAGEQTCGDDPSNNLAAFALIDLIEAHESRMSYERRSLKMMALSQSNCKSVRIPGRQDHSNHLEALSSRGISSTISTRAATLLRLLMV